MPFLGPAPPGLETRQPSRATSRIPRPAPTPHSGLQETGVRDGARGPHGHLPGKRPFPVPASQEPGFLNKCFPFFSQDSASSNWGVGGQEKPPGQRPPSSGSLASAWPLVLPPGAFAERGPAHGVPPARRPRHPACLLRQPCGWRGSWLAPWAAQHTPPAFCSPSSWVQGVVTSAGEVLGSHPCIIASLHHPGLVLALTVWAEQGWVWVPS